MEIKDLDISYLRKIGYVGTDKELTEIKKFLETKIGEFDTINNLEEKYNKCFVENEKITKKLFVNIELINIKSSFSKLFEVVLLFCGSFFPFTIFVAINIFFANNYLFFTLIGGLFVLPKLICKYIGNKKGHVIYDEIKKNILHVLEEKKCDKDTNKQNEDQEVDYFIKQILFDIKNIKNNDYPNCIEDVKKLHELATEYVNYQIYLTENSDNVVLSLAESDFYARLNKIEMDIDKNRKLYLYLEKNEDLIEESMQKFVIPTLSDGLSLKLSKKKQNK